MRKLLLVIFLLSFHTLSFSPNLNKEELKQNITQCNLFKDISYVISKAPTAHLNLKAIPLISPIDITALIKINSEFGNRIHPVLKVKKHHDGIDIDAPINTNIVSTGDGYIEKVERNKYGYGNCIIINHVNGYKTRYAHLHKIYVKERQRVTRNTIIGTTGNTGLTTGPHLHYEVHHNGVKQNPVDYFFDDLSLF
jgi:murein DD-endopeptidase MepM/ murein hydrolase activator NlpD